MGTADMLALIYDDKLMKLGGVHQQYSEGVFITPSLCSYIKYLDDEWTWEIPNDIPDLCCYGYYTYT